MMTMSDVKRSINDYLFEQTKGEVQSGPFKGMALSREESWTDGNLSCKILGCYEEELHSYIEREIAFLSNLPSPVIVDVGCADGYYAVGLALRVPKATLFAVDTSTASLQVTSDAAKNNGAKVIAGATLAEVFAGPDLVIMDCEGAEVDYLDLEKFPALTNSSIIVELHGWAENPIRETITERFKGTHSIIHITEGARNPNRFPILHNLHSLDRWMSVSEGRPCLMDWLVMSPFQPRSQQ